MRPFHLSATLVTAAALAFGCGEGEEDDVRAAVAEFVRATNERDFPAVCRAFDRSTRRGLSRGGRSCAERLRAAAADGREEISIEVRKVRVDGERATVRADLGSGERTARRNQTLRLAQEAGEWKLRFTPEPG